MPPRRKAFVTGASRGIGKAIAIRLAQGGFDVAITARTMEEGERREHSSTVKKSDTTALPGSLASTADALRAAGAEVLVLPADLLDRGSLGAAATTLLERWGAVDLVVHNARFIGPGLPQENRRRKQIQRPMEERVPRSKAARIGLRNDRASGRSSGCGIKRGILRCNQLANCFPAQRQHFVELCL